MSYSALHLYNRIILYSVIASMMGIMPLSFAAFHLTTSTNSPLFTFAPLRNENKEEVQVEKLGIPAGHPVATGEHATAFLKAVESGDDFCLKDLVQTHLNIITVDEKGETLLHYVARWGRGAMVPCLVPPYKAANLLDWQNVQGNTSLIIAAEYGHRKCVEKLIEAGVDIRKSNKKGFNALHKAACWGRSDVVAYLLPYYIKAGLLDAETSTGDTALSLALENENKACIKILCEAGAKETTCPMKGCIIV